MESNFMGSQDSIPLKFKQTSNTPLLKKPSWIRVKLPNHSEVPKLKSLLRQKRLHTVCEEASCPNLPECFSSGTATFMIMGNTCTRKCRFCDVSHGRPLPLDPLEPQHLAEAIKTMNLNYVVITSVDRDDLDDGGAGHFVECIRAVRSVIPGIKIEILVPDFRKCLHKATQILSSEPPDVFNHNLETIPRLYKRCRPGARYEGSLKLLSEFKKHNSNVLTKSGVMLGLGEELHEVEEVMHDLHEHNCDMVTIGQYLQPSVEHLPVSRYVTPDEFNSLKYLGEKIGFSNVASGPFVRSSYHADLQAGSLV